MTIKQTVSTTLVAVAVGVASLVASNGAGSPQQAVKMPDPGVPQIMTLEGKFVRVAYNNEGYVILGYQIANRTIGNDWIMLDVGMTLMNRGKDYTMTRDALSLETPDGTLPLPSIAEYRKAVAKTQPLQARMKSQRDSINYFPPWVHGVNRLGFFADLDSNAMPWDQVDVSYERAAMGQLYFNVPTGTKYGQYWLNVKFPQTMVRVPFRLLTEEEEKKLGKNYGDIKKAIDNAFRKKK